MAVNKIEINGEVKLDLTEDTVTEDTLLKGITAHNAAGSKIQGRVVITPVPESQEKTLDITANGMYTAEPDNGKMLTKVTAKVNVPSKPEQTKSVIITSNGTTTVMPDDGKTLSSVSITTNVPVNGIPGRKIGTYAVTDGILSFSVEQEDFAFDDRYANFYVKKSSVKWGCFAHRTASTDIKSWIATTEESAAFVFNRTCISVEQSGAFYNISWTLGDSMSNYYSGEVTVYALPSS